jgi:pimeloyl-ACP methyl ester carboxylesterase
MLGYEIDGHGPPLLLIHGFGISFQIWNELRPYLRDHFTLIMVEMPGIGRTPAPAPGLPYLDAAVQGIELVRASLGIERWRVLSYSSGTRVAEHYLNQHAECVERAIFLCPIQTQALTASALLTALRLDLKFPRLGNWVLSGPRFRFLLDLLGFNMKRNPLSTAWFKEITSQPVDILKETLRTMPAGGAAKFRLPSNLPILFIWGREDLITASPRRTTGGNLVIPGAHSAPQTSAREVAEGILPFLS